MKRLLNGQSYPINTMKPTTEALPLPSLFVSCGQNGFHANTPCNLESLLREDLDKLPSALEE